VLSIDRLTGVVLSVLKVLLVDVIKQTLEVLPECFLVALHRQGVVTFSLNHSQGNPRLAAQDVPRDDTPVQLQRFQSSALLCADVRRFSDSQVLTMCTGSLARYHHGSI
jgi:hypothetical protein